MAASARFRSVMSRIIEWMIVFPPISILLSEISVVNGVPSHRMWIHSNASGDPESTCSSLARIRPSDLLPSGWNSGENSATGCPMISDSSVQPNI